LKDTGLHNSGQVAEQLSAPALCTRVSQVCSTSSTHTD
jgi:hypothetical protein